MNEIIHGLSFDDYKQIDAVNFSSLKHIARSPAYYKHMLTAEHSTKSMDIGRAVHTKVLEPDKFNDSVVAYAGTRRGASWECFKDDNKGKEILKPAEFNTVKRIGNSVVFHPLAGHIFADHSASAEVTLVWTDPNTGIDCKARVDWLQDGRIVDLKTTADPAPHEFSKSAARYRYFTQFAFYAHGYHTITGERLDIACVAVGNKDPHEVVVYEVDGSCINHGNTEFTAMLELLKECREKDNFEPIAFNGPQLLTVPEWCKPFGEDDSDPFAEL